MMSRIGKTVFQDEEEELGPMIITRRKWEVHGIHQSLHPKVRHGELPQCERCYGKFTEFQSNDWKVSWDLSLESPAELRDGPGKWNKSMSSYLYTAT